jgi:adenosine deaminase
LPIIDLHCHIEGSIAPDKSYEILHRIDHPLARDRETFMERVTAFKWEMGGFFGAISFLDRCMMDRAAVTEVVSDIVSRAAEQNVKILEPTFAPAEFRLREADTGDLRPFTEAVIAGVARGTHNRDIRVGLRMLVLPRHLTDAFCETYGDVQAHVAEYGQHLVGVDICTLDPINEVPHDSRRLRALCDWVKASGLHLSAHAGEFTDAAPVAQAVDLGVERIGHGIRIVDDPAVLERIVAQGITLEVCPISNYRTGALAPGQEHPLRRLLRAGVRVTINSDDQGVQNSSWRDDYDFAAREIGLTGGEIRHCLRTSFEASFLSAGEKKKYGDLYPPAERRCRGAIVRGRQILLLQHQHCGTGHTYWWFPGGGRKPGESDEACVAREIVEEVGLDVRVERSLSLPQDWRGGYHVVYLCTPLSGEVRLGTEEEGRTLIGFRWVPLDDERSWEPEFYQDHIYPVLQAVQREGLGDVLV